MAACCDIADDETMCIHDIGHIGLYRATVGKKLSVRLCRELERGNAPIRTILALKETARQVAATADLLIQERGV